MRFAIAFFLFTSSASAQAALQNQLRTIAADAHGKVSVACSLPGSGVICDFNPHAPPPMQSIFKFPLVVTALHLM